MRRIFIFVVLLIVYGSLYPWHFVWRELPANPLWLLAHSWPRRFDKWILRDGVVNVALYVPLGMSAALAFRRSLYVPVLIGFSLSVSIELLQRFEPGRDSSAMDVTTNVIGTIAGVAMALVFEKLAGPEWLSPSARLAGRKLRDRGALLLLFVWAGYLLFPFFPVFGLYNRFQKVRIFLDAPFGAVALISGLAMWLAAGKLMEAAGVRDSRKWLAISLLAIPAQFFVIDHQPVLADFAGGAAGLLIYIAVGKERSASYWIAAVFVGAIVFRGLSPFHFVPQPSAFAWVPFSGFLNTDWQRGIEILLEKAFYYGTAVWLLRSCRMPVWTSGAIIAAVLAGIEFAQIYLPGRTAESTDPILALVLAFGLGAVSRGTAPVAVPAARSRR